MVGILPFFTRKLTSETSCMFSYMIQEEQLSVSGQRIDHGLTGLKDLSLPRKSVVKLIELT